MIEDLTFLCVSLDPIPAGRVHGSCRRLMSSMKKTGLPFKADILHNSPTPLFPNESNISESSIPATKINPLLQSQFGRYFRVKALSFYVPEHIEGWTVLIDVDIICLRIPTQLKLQNTHSIISHKIRVMDDSTLINSPSFAIIRNDLVPDIMQTWWKNLLILDDQGICRPDVLAWDRTLKSKFSIIPDLPMGLLSSSNDSISSLFKTSFLHLGEVPKQSRSRLDKNVKWPEKDTLLSALSLSKHYPQFIYETEKLLS